MLEPLPSNEWTLEAAAHLLNRAAFGGTPQDIQALYKMGHQAAVKTLLNPNITDPFNDGDNGQIIEKLEELKWKVKKGKYRIQGLGAVKSRWMYGMFSQTFSAREKLTLFWFGSHLPVFSRAPIPYAKYIRCLRHLGLGEYNKLLKGVYRQEAMREYLTLNNNIAKNPNENFARELMELFTIGEGNYTEEDVRQVARAFTGNPHNKQFHDTGIKTVLNCTGNFSGDDVIDILTSMKQCSVLVASKMWKFYAGKAADEHTLNTLADFYNSNNMITSNLLEQIFMCKEFYNIKYRRIIIKSPIEWVIQLSKSLQLTFEDINISRSHFIAAKLGQNLTSPPNVKGWSGGKDWITSSSLFDRCNFSQAFLDNTPDSTLHKIFPSKTSPELICNIVSARFFQSPPSLKLRNKLLDVLKRTTDDVLSKKEFIRLIVSTTEYQLT